MGNDFFSKLYSLIEEAGPNLSECKFSMSIGGSDKSIALKIVLGGEKLPIIKGESQTDLLEKVRGELKLRTEEETKRILDRRIRYFIDEPTSIIDRLNKLVGTNGERTEITIRAYSFLTEAREARNDINYSIAISALQAIPIIEQIIKANGLILKEPVKA